MTRGQYVYFHTSALNMAIRGIAYVYHMALCPERSARNVFSFSYDGNNEPTV